MIALVVVSMFVVLLLGILVAGLLRSHADILRSLHELGVGVGDPARHDEHASAAPAPVPLSPPARAPALGPAPTVAGVTPSGDARAIGVTHGDGLTLLAFLSSGCASCAAFWDALQSPTGLDLPAATRVVIVTKGADREVVSEVRGRTTGRVPVVMSTEAWIDYEIPGSPFFVLVDADGGRKVGQGVANHVAQLAELVRRAERDRADDGRPKRRPPDTGLGGPEREEAVDDVLRRAGIEPGDPSLYPRSLEDVFPFAAGTSAPATAE